MIGVVLAAAVVFAQAAPAAEPSSTSPAPVPPGHAVSPVVVTGQKPAVADKGDELVCHSEPVLGTLFPKRICARRDEIAERRNVDQASVRAAQALRPFKTN